jgi:hypothetical protein
LQEILAMAQATSICPITEQPLDYSRYRGLHPDSASLDRADPDRGYTSDNVSIISHVANRARARLSIGESINLGRYAAAQMAKRHERDRQLVNSLDDAITAMQTACAFFESRSGKQ